MNVLALTSYHMFKLVTRTSRIPLLFNHKADQEVPRSAARRIIIKFLTKEGVIPSEIFTSFKHSLHSQGCSVGRNRFEKDETMLKMNLTLGDQ
jgi:hypothetical protein